MKDVSDYPMINAEQRLTLISPERTILRPSATTWEGSDLLFALPGN